MIRLIVASQGAGKTKQLIELANSAVKSVKGHIVYLDGDSSHMLDLHHDIRYTNLSEYPISDYKEFFGFMCGVLSEDNDIDEIYADGLMRLAHVGLEHVDELVNNLKRLSDMFDVKFIFTVCCEVDVLPNSLKGFVV